jgi:hypothetical protein
LPLSPTPRPVVPATRWDYGTRPLARRYGGTPAASRLPYSPHLAGWCHRHLEPLPSPGAAFFSTSGRRRRPRNTRQSRRRWSSDGSEVGGGSQPTVTHLVSNVLGRRTFRDVMSRMGARTAQQSGTVTAGCGDLSAAQFSLASWSASTRSSTSRAVSSQDRATLTMICRSLGFVACSAHSTQVRQNCITLSFFTMVVAPGRAGSTGGRLKVSGGNPRSAPFLEHLIVSLNPERGTRYNSASGSRPRALSTKPQGHSSLTPLRVWRDSGSLLT